MKALFLGLQAFQEDVASHHVTAMCDNSTVVAYVNKQGGTVSRSLCSLTSHLLRWTESFDVHLDARYLPGESNVLADVLSRRGQVVGTEWSLHPQVARALLRAWGNPSIDLFATCLNAKLPLYCSLVPDPQAVFEDSFRHPWDDLCSGRSGDRPRPRVVACRDDSGRASLARGVVRRLAASTDPTTPVSTLRLLSRFACGLLMFSAWWTVPFLLALSGAPGLQSFFSFSSAQISLSLSRPLLLQPLAPGILLVGACVCLGYFHGLDCPSPSHGGLPIGIPAFLSGSLPVALSHLPGGVRLFCFAGRPSSPFFWFIRGIRCSSWLSPLHSARFWFIVFSVPCGWAGALLPSLRPTPGLSLFGLLAVPPFLLSRFLAVCFPGLWVSLFPGSFLVLGSSFPVLVFYSFLLRGTRGGIWILPSAPLGFFILLSPTSLRRLFRLFSWFQGFLSYFSDLVFSIALSPV